MRIEVENRLEEIAVVNAAFNGFARDHELPDRMRRHVELILDELLNNIISHAWPEGGEHRIRVNVDLGTDRLVLVVSDDGRAFDPLGRGDADIDIPLDQRTAGGLGIHLVRRLGDEVEYRRESGRNVLTVTMMLPRENRARPDRVP